ncbi:MAG: response regulator [Acidimicrobiales bacterium]
MVDVIRVVVVDDQALVRGGLASLLSLEPDIEVVAEADDGSTGVAMIRRHRPDVAVMDIRMPGMDGLEATRQITADGDLPAVRVLILSTFELDEYVFAALEAGASGFVVKHADPAELVNAVRVVAAGDSLLSPSVTRRVVAHFAGRPPEPGSVNPPAADRAVPAAGLTERERQAVGMVAAGLSNAEIADHWSVSQATVRSHVSRAMTKLHARDRAQLVVIAYQRGLARPPA